MFLPLHCSSFDYMLILVFNYRIELGGYRSHNTGSLYVYQINPIRKQIDDKDSCLSLVHAKLFNHKLMSDLALCTHELKYQKLGS